MSESQTRKLALFRAVGEYDFEQLGEEFLESNEGYVRVSHYSEITFKMLDPSVYVGKQIEVLNKMKDTLREETHVKMASIDERIGKLAAITHQPTELPDLDPEGTLKAQDDLSAEGERV